MITQFGTERILYMDEARMTQSDVYAYGWSPRGQCCHAKRTGKTRHRVSFISAIGQQRQFIAPIVFEGSCTRQVVEAWLEELMTVLPKDAQDKVLPHVIVMDNASYHKNGKLEHIAQKHQCQLLYLPPYSPDLNPIEQCWAVLKNQVKQALSQGEELIQAICTTFKYL